MSSPAISPATTAQMFAVHAVVESSPYGVDFFADWETMVMPALDQLNQSRAMAEFLRCANNDTYNNLLARWKLAVVQTGMCDDVEGIAFTPIYCALLNTEQLPAYDPARRGYPQPNDLELARCVCPLTLPLLSSIALVPAQRHAQFVQMADFVVALRALLMADAEAIQGVAQEAHAADVDMDDDY